MLDIVYYVLEKNLYSARIGNLFDSPKILLAMRVSDLPKPLYFSGLSHLNKAEFSVFITFASLFWVSMAFNSKLYSICT